MNKTILVMLFLLTGSSIFLFYPLKGQAEEEEEEEGRKQLVQELFLTEVVYPQEMGEVQFTLWPTYFSGEELSFFDLALTIEYGITNHLQLETTWLGYTQSFSKEEELQGKAGIGDLEVGVKYTFEEIRAWELQIAVGLEGYLPVGTKVLSINAYYVEPFIVFSKYFGHFLDIQLNVGYGFKVSERNVNYDEFESEQEEPVDELEVNAGVIYAVSNSWRTTLEINFEKGDDTILFILPGIVWQGSGLLEVGLGVPVGLTPESPSWAVMSMITYEFEMPWAD